MTQHKKENQTLVMGLHCVHEVVSHQPERVIKVLISNMETELSARKASLLEMIKKKKLEIEKVSMKTLDRTCDSKSHQGFVALLKKRETLSLSSFLKNEKETSFVLALDSIYDPQNLGAILRAAECFGVDLVIWSKNRGASLTPVVAKTSSAASEIIPICLVSNLSTAIQEFSKKGYFVAAAHLDAKSESLFEFKYPEKTLLILGSEGEGVRPLLQKQADTLLQVPMYGRIDSLNVSQAAALFLAHWKRQQSL
ncbi:MAG: 23S rRNA (guanosine-2'-O-)-methyltransferase RlmB [Chlamydiae bacterium]|nr:23S rRNA (guanosine-2'-O-)-methyltransferase RlmB [Chlamydiota bacterium]